MFPTLLEIGPLHLRTFGVLLAVSFIAGSAYALHRGKQRGMDDEFLLQLFWWILLSSIAGARLYFIFVHPEEFAGPLDALRLWEGGMVLYGGILGAMAVSWWICRRRGVSFLMVADVCAPPLAMGEGVSRIGCFLNGCCFGSACTQPWGVHYPAESWPAVLLGSGVAVHPAPLYLAAGAFVILGVLLAVESRSMRLGQTIGLYLLLGSVLRFFVDYTRYYEEADYLSVLGSALTHSQAVALLLGLWGLGLVLFARQAPPPIEAPGEAPADPGAGPGDPAGGTTQGETDA